MPSKERNAEEFLGKYEKIDSDIQFAKVSVRLAQLKRKYKDSLRLNDSLTEQIEVLAGLRGAPVIQKLKRRPKGKAGGVSVIVPATDWHVEEGVTLEGTGGKNFFNLVEAERRIKQFYAKVVKIIDWQNGLAPVTELWHPLLGDLLSGYIHEELAESNELSPTEACVFLQEMITSGIEFLLKETKLPIYLPTCVGNHGRTTQKMRIKTSYKNSYEWLLYSTLARYYNSNPRVNFKVGKAYHNICEIQGRKVRFHHGDGIRYQGGVGGISIPVNKAIAQWDKIEQVDLDVFGHYHTYLWNYNKWVSCGSLMGYNEYSISIKADWQHPTQTLIALDHNFGVTMSIPIFLTKARGAK